MHSTEGKRQLPPMSPICDCIQMSVDLDFSDLPIQAPDEDRFGILPFVRSLARSVSQMRRPEGVVIAINGPWGSGKSSAMNLLKHELAANEDLVVVSFNPWWFRGEEALVLAFFRELYTATKPSMGERARKVLPKLGARLLKAGGAIGPAVDLAGGSGVGSIASGTLSWLSDMIEQDESVEKLHAELSAALSGQQKRFLVLIDDIDRLSPDEALAMFRLVKSVGRLPNIIYVLAFDRLLAEKVVQERYPSEGPHYLEKIVQAAFELPQPDAEQLRQSLLSGLFAISGQPEDGKIVHVMNLFYEVVAPEIRTPRDVVRMLNAFAVTWAAVEGDVDQGDFIALETLRVFQPAIYAAVRNHGSLLTGGARSGAGRAEKTGEELDDLLLRSGSDKRRYRDGLMRLFPKLQSLWSNTYYDRDESWERDRRAYSPKHFSTYFRLAPAPGTLSAAQVRELLAVTDDAEKLQAALIEAGKLRKPNGTSRVSLVLDALNLHASEIPIEQAMAFLSAIFAVADQIEVECDRGRPFEDFSTGLRLHWLLRSLLRGRTSLQERSDILVAALASAQLGWFVDLAESTWTAYHPREGKEPASEDDCLVTAEATDALRAQSHMRIATAADDGSLIEHPHLAYLLYRWLDASEDAGAAVRAWTQLQLDDPHCLAQLARAFTSYSWVQGLGMFSPGDHVAKRVDRADVGSLDKLLDATAFKQRLEAMAEITNPEDEDGKDVRRFLAAWNSSDRH